MVRESVALSRSRIAFLAHKLRYERENVTAISELFVDAVARTISECGEAQDAYLAALQEVCATR